MVEVVMWLVCIPVVMACLVFVLVASKTVHELRDENFSLRQDEYHARVQVEQFKKQVEKLKKDAVWVSTNSEILLRLAEKESEELRDELADIHAALKTDAAKRRLKDWRELAQTITEGE